MTDTLRYPIGLAPQFGWLSLPQRAGGIAALRTLPTELERAVAGLNDGQLDTPYREGGWTVRQVVHHLADSHLNAFVRMKLVLTEREPVIKPWSEVDWAALPDSALPIQPSLALLRGLHARWTKLYESLTDNDWERTFIHPQLIAVQDRADAPWARAFNADARGHVRLDQLLTTYAWHGQHHVAHILNLRERRDW